MTEGRIAKWTLIHGVGCRDADIDDQVKDGKYVLIDHPVRNLSNSNFIQLVSFLCLLPLSFFLPLQKHFISIIIKKNSAASLSLSAQAFTTASALEKINDNVISL